MKQRKKTSRVIQVLTSSPISNHPLQKIIWKDKARFIVNVCGRRFGKTFLAREKLCALTEIQKSINWYIAPTRGQAKELMWDEVKNRFDELGWRYKKNESELWIERVSNSSRIYIKGAEKHDRLRGKGVNFHIWDEFDDIDRKAWTLSARATLSDKRGGAWFLGTPKGFHNLYDMFQMAKTTQDWSCHQFRTIDSPFFQTPEGMAEIEAAKRDLDEKSFNQEYLALFESFSGRIYYEFDRSANVGIRDFKSENWVGLDFNLDPFTGVVAYVSADEIYIHDEIYLRNSNTDEAAQVIKERHGICRIVPDSTGAGNKTSSMGRSDHVILKEYGHIIDSVFNPHRVDRYASVNRLFRAKKLTINPKCKMLINDLERAVYKDGTSFLDESDKMIGHITDAMGYLVYKTHGILKKKQNAQIQL